MRTSSNPWTVLLVPALALCGAVACDNEAAPGVEAGGDTGGPGQGGSTSGGVAGTSGSGAATSMGTGSSAAQVSSAGGASSGDVVPSSGAGQASSEPLPNSSGGAAGTSASAPASSGAGAASSALMSASSAAAPASSAAGGASSAAGTASSAPAVASSGPAVLSSSSAATSSTSVVVVSSSQPGVSSSAMPPVSSSSVASSSSVGVSSSSASMCTPPTLPDPCVGIPADGVMRTVVTSGNNVGITGLIRVGQTLQQVRGNLPQNLERGVNVGVAAGPGLGAAGLALGALGLPVYGVVYCPQRLGVVFRDGDNDAGAGVLSTDDVVVRISVREGFTGATDTGVTLGDSRLDVQNAYGTGPGYAQGATWPLRSSDLYTRGGASFFVDGPALDATLESFSVHARLEPAESLQPTPANAPISLDPGRLGTQQRGVTAALVGGSQFGNVPERMGEPELRGRASVGNTMLNYMAWLQAGVVVVAGDPVLGIQPVISLVVLPPYGGRFTSGNGTVLGIGSSRAEWNAAGLVDNGTSMLGSAVVQRYRVRTGFGANETGVVFVQESDCTERAAAIILNYVAN